MGKKQAKAPTHFVVNRKKYTIVKKIADGGFSNIYKVKHKGMVYALKRIGVYDATDAEKFLEEATLMKKFSHNKNIIHLVDCCSRPNENGILEVIIVMEYCKRNLNQVMIDFGKNKKYDNSHKIMIFHQICLALASFHYNDPPLLHRDIKSENILQQTEDNYLLCDFGSVTEKIYDPKTTSFHVISEDINNNTTLAYRAPEMISQLEGKIISTKADIWALGCLLYKIYHGDTPFGESAGQIIDGFNEFPKDSSCPDNVKDLIRSMLHSDPDQRPNIYEVHLHTSKIMERPPELSPLEKPTSSVANETSPYSASQQSKTVTSCSLGFNPEPPPLSTRRNPFGHEIVNSGNMDFSQCREMLRQAKLQTESSNSRHDDQSVECVTSSQHSVASKANSQNIMTTSFELFDSTREINQEYNSPVCTLAPTKSHHRHRSLNEQMVKLTFYGKKNGAFNMLPKIGNTDKNEVKFASQNSESPTPIRNPFRLVNNNDKKATSDESDMFNPFLTYETKKQNRRSLILQPSSPLSVEHVEDQGRSPNGSPNPFKTDHTPICSTPKSTNPFRDNTSAKQTPVIECKHNSTAVSNDFTPIQIASSNKNDSDESSLSTKTKFPNPFLSSTDTPSPFKP